MSKPYHIYLDLDVLNSDTAPSSRAPVLSFEETRTHPFLEGSASDYFVSIVRFSIQTGTSLPVFIPRIATGGYGELLRGPRLYEILALSIIR